MALGGGDFGRRLGHEGVALLNEISTLIKKIPESLFTPFHHMETQHNYSYESGRKPSPNRLAH